MEFLHTLKDWLDPKMLIEQFGYIGLFSIVFAESGLFFGFFLPGDSLLIIAGVLAATGLLKIGYLLPLVFIAAILGDQVGYFTGHKLGRRFFNRDKGWLFHKSRISEAEAFFKKHGNKTIVLARFVPIVRTFAPIVAGIGSMPYPVFLAYNLLGGALWGVGLLLVGYFLGTSIPDIDKYIHYILGGIVIVSLVPVAIHILPKKSAKKE